jgi:hypothetical protein
MKGRTVEMMLVEIDLDPVDFAMLSNDRETRNRTLSDMGRQAWITF